MKTRCEHGRRMREGQVLARVSHRIRRLVILSIRCVGNRFVGSSNCNSTTASRLASNVLSLELTAAAVDEIAGVGL